MDKMMSKIKKVDVLMGENDIGLSVSVGYSNIDSIEDVVGAIYGIMTDLLIRYKGSDKPLTFEDLLEMLADMELQIGVVATNSQVNVDLTEEDNINAMKQLAEDYTATHKDE